MKKQIIAFCLLIVILVISYFVYSQFDNIKDLFFSFKYSTDEIETMVSQNNGKLKEQIEELVGESVRPFTEQENSQIENGEITENEVVEKILKEELLDKPRKTSQEGKEDKNLSQVYIADLYELKSYYIGLLDSMVDSAVSEYKSLSKEQRTRSKQIDIGTEYAKKALSLEKECDSKVDSLLKKIEQQLKVEGKSTDIVTTLKTAYDSEKRMKMAHYLNMFKK